MKHHSHPRSSKPTFGSAAVVTALTLAIVPAAIADTTWISTSSTSFITTGNWTAGLPSTGPQLAIFADSATVQHTVDITGVTARNSVGLRFDSFAGGNGFTFGSSANNSPGFQLRAGGTVSGILNNDNNTQTFNVSVAMFNSSGNTGAGAAQTFNAAAGDLVFSGNHPTGRSTITNGGGNLTITGSHNVTIGVSGATFGNITGAGGLIKNGTGTLTLGGNTANTYTGGNVINQGTVVAAKANALGAGNSLQMSGGTFNTGGLNQDLGTLDLEGSATIDLGNGTTDLKFADSSAIDWSTFTLTILNYTVGSDTVEFGLNNSGLTQSQLDHIIFGDQGNSTAQIDGNGFLSPVPVPEPSTVALGMFGGLGMLFMFRRVRAKK